MLTHAFVLYSNIGPTNGHQLKLVQPIEANHLVHMQRPNSGVVYTHVENFANDTITTARKTVTTIRRAFGDIYSDAQISNMSARRSPETPWYTSLERFLVVI